MNEYVPVDDTLRAIEKRLGWNTLVVFD